MTQVYLTQGPVPSTMTNAAAKTEEMSLFFLFGLVVEDTESGSKALGQISLYLCDFGQVTQHLCASAASFVKWE